MLSPQMTLRQFFVEFFEPQVLDGSPYLYYLALDRWEQLTDDPPLAAITSQTLLAFKQKLATAQSGRGTGPLSVNTQRTRFDHVQWIIDRAGPRTWRLREAAGLIDTFPSARPPRRERHRKPPMDEARVVGIYLAAESATIPRIPGINPGAWWRALISVMGSTSLRIGQIVRTPYGAMRWDAANPLLVVPAEVCRKSRQDELHVLHPVAFRDLAAIRGDRELLFPAWPRPHSKTAIYRQFHRLERAAGFDPDDGVAFHGIRRRVLTELAKISPSAAQQAAGHASYKTTIEHYLGDEIVAEAVQQLRLFDKLG